MKTTAKQLTTTSRVAYVMLTTTLDTGWPLHGARDHEQLTAIINSLIADTPRVDIARDLGVSQDVVSDVARWYQSLWMQA